MAQLVEPEVISLTLPTIIATSPHPPDPSPSPSPQANKTPQPSPTIVIEYIVQAGDTLSGIAAKFNILLADLLDANPEQDPSLLGINDVLIIPPRVTPSFHALKMEEYTVQKGDTLLQIAHQFDLSVDELRQANPDMRSDTIDIGDILLIPVTQTPIVAKTTTPANDEPETYIVRRGDTLLGIASQFDISLPELQAANPNLDPTRLKIGEPIFIPDPSEKKE